MSELLELTDAAELAGVTAGTLRRAARRGTLPGAVRHGGRWRVTPEGAIAYRDAERGAGRPAVAGLEVEPVSAFPHRPEWRARIDGGPWSVSDTRDKAVKAAHAAARKRRVVEAQRRELDRWHGVPRGALRPAEDAAAGARVVIPVRRELRRAVVLEVTRSGAVVVGYVDPSRPGRVTVRPVALGLVLVEAGRGARS